jgi:hypothetical protein
MSCSSCGCTPCCCAGNACPNPSVLSNARLIDPNISGGSWVGGTLNGPTINGGTLNGPQITGATIDCTTQGCTQPPGTCDGTLANTAYVCQALSDAISGANPNFCNAVAACLGADPGTCGLVANCINTTPGIIQNPAAFDPATFATTVTIGVARFATLVEVQGASCLVSVDPCTLGAFWSAGGPNALWTAFTAGVCAAGATCFAPITSPVFLGDPQAPTPAPGDNDASIATTAFVTAAIVAGAFAPINNPVFTGDPQAPTPLAGDSDTSIATTAYVQNELTLLLGPTVAFCTAVGSCGYALLNSPAFIGVPIAPTAAPGDNSASIATTAFVQGEITTAIATFTGGPIFNSAVAVGNLAATETDAFSHVIAANTLAVDGDAIEIESAGTFAGTASVDKRIRVYFGAAIVFDSGNLAIIVASSWRLRCTIVRTGVSAEKIVTTLTTSDTTIQAIAQYSTAAQNTAVGQTTKLTLNGTLANDVIAEFYRDRLVSA